MDLKELRIIRAYVSPYSLRLTAITVLSVICAFFEAVSLGALVPLLQLMESEQEPGGTLWNYLKAFFDVLGVPLTFLTLLGFLTLLFLFGQVLLYIKKRMQVNLRVNLVADLKKRLYREILHADISYHNTQKAGNLLNTLIMEVDNAGFGLFASLEMMTDAFFIGVYALMLLYISVDMTLLCLAITLITFLALNQVLRKSTILGRELVGWNTTQNEFLSERFNLLRLIKSSSNEDAEAGRFSGISDGFRAAHARYGINGVKIEIIFQAIIFILAVVVLSVSIGIFSIPLAMLFLFLFILVRITGPLRDLNTRRHELAREIPSFLKIHQILRSALAAQKIRNGSRPFLAFEREIALSHVSFSYGNGSEVISDVSLKIGKGEMVALVGPSGGGKSTLADLIIRLLDPDEGEVLVDDVNLKEFDLTTYRNKLGVVSQETFLFHDTVLANICYGTDHVSRDDAAAAAILANAHEFITQLPQGYDTLLGERGATISGGQRQRICLARALYKRPEILILDEATSSLDTESERIIQASILNLKRQYTIIAIAHRLSTIENADRIYVIEKGKVVEVGNHKDLIDSGGYYSKYYNKQYGNG
jgi:subfamily B ATP-binding cassette protein MsbA